MSLPGELPSREIIRPPETPEEKWIESIRLAASIIDVNTQLNKHNSKKTKSVGVTDSPKFEEHEWTDPSGYDRFILRRFWSRSSASNPNWKADYQLRVHFGEEEFDLGSPDIIYSIDSTKNFDEKDSLSIVEDNECVELSEWCEMEGEDVDKQYDCVYEYLKTSQTTAEAQLTARRSRVTGELSDDNAEFAKIILGEAVVANQVLIKKVNQLRKIDVLTESNFIATSIVKSPPKSRRRLARRNQGSPDVYRGSDTNPSKWLLSQQAVALAIAELLLSDSEQTALSENPDTIA